MAIPGLSRTSADRAVAARELAQTNELAIDALEVKVTTVEIEDTSGTITIDSIGTADTTVNIENSNSTYKADLVVEGEITSTEGLINSAKFLGATAVELEASAGNITLDAVGGADTTCAIGNSGAAQCNTTIDGTLTVAEAITATTGGVTATAGGVTATAGGVTATLGDIVCTAGAITATVGAVNAATTVTSTTGKFAGATVAELEAGAGNITLDAIGAGTTSVDVGNSGGGVADFSVDGAAVVAGALTSTAGPITATAGDVVSAAGAVTAGTSMTAATTITSTTGKFAGGTDNAELEAPAGSITLDAIGAGTTAVAVGNSGGGVADLSVDGAAVVAGALTSTAGPITATAGDIVSAAGAVTSGTTMTAGTGLTATTGGVTATAGGLLVTAGRIREVMSATDINTQNDTMVVADIAKGIYVHTSVTGAGTVTTDTAANIIAGEGGVGALTADDQCLKCYYINDGDQTVTFGGGSGVTVADAGCTIGVNCAATLLFQRTSGSTVTLYIIGSVAA